MKRSLLFLATCLAMMPLAPAAVVSPVPEDGDTPKTDAPSAEDSKPAATKAEAPSAVKVSPAADKILRAASDFYKGLKSSSAEGKMTIREEVHGQKNLVEVKVIVAAARPNLFLLTMTEATQGGASFICDGKNLVTYLMPIKQYTERPAPPSLEEVVNTDEAGMAGLAQMGFLRDFFGNDPYAAVRKDVITLDVAGMDKIDGVECDHLRGEQEEVDWDVWFEKGKKPALRKFSFSPLKGIIKQAEEATKDQLKDAKLEVTLEFGRWKIDTKLPRETFTFKAPEGVEKVTQFKGLHEPQEMEEDGDRPESKPEGEPAGRN